MTEGDVSIPLQKDGSCGCLSCRFDRWWVQLLMAAKRRNYPLNEDKHAWRAYFDDGYTPDEAISEDAS